MANPWEEVQTTPVAKAASNPWDDVAPTNTPEAQAESSQNTIQALAGHPIDAAIDIGKKVLDLKDTSREMVAIGDTIGGALGFTMETGGAIVSDVGKFL